MISPENQPSKFSLIPVSCSRRPGYEATTINSCLYSIVSRDVRAEYQIAKSSQAVVHRDDNRTSGVSNVLTIIKFASRVALRTSNSNTLQLIYHNLTSWSYFTTHSNEVPAMNKHHHREV